MPKRHYRHTRRAVSETVLARLTAGEVLARICAEPEMPAARTVLAWARADASFAEALADARRRGGFRRRGAFDEDKAKVLLARLAAGERIDAVLRDPAMPSRWLYAYWRATQPAFAEAVWRLNQGKAEVTADRFRGRGRPFDPALADRLVVRVSEGRPLASLFGSGQGFPSGNVITRWRREQPEFDAALGVAVRVGTRRRRATALRTPKLEAKILDLIRTGESLESLARRPDMPSISALRAWTRRSEAFADAVAQACDDREDWFYDRMQMVAEADAPFAERAAEIARLKARLGKLARRPGARWRRGRHG